MEFYLGGNHIVLFPLINKKLYEAVKIFQQQCLVTILSLLTKKECTA